MLWPTLLVGVLGVIVTIGIGHVVVRGPARNAPMPAVLVLVFVFAASVFVTAWAGPWNTDPWSALALYWFGAVAYLFVFAGLYKSVSVRLLIDARHTPGGALDLRTVREGYLREESFHGRVKRLVDDGYIAEQSGVLRLTPKGTYVTRVVAPLQALLGVRLSG